MGRTAYDHKLQGQPNRPFPLGNDYEAISDPVGTRIFRSWCCLWRAGNPKLCLGAGNSGQLQIFRFVRFGDGICGLWRGRQNPPLATVIDPLVVRGTCISAMASARPLHYLWDFVMTPKRPGDPNQLAKAIFDIATGEKPNRDPTPEEQGKDPAVRHPAFSVAGPRCFECEQRKRHSILVCYL